MEIVLSIAGSDPSAGAGIQQDLKTITAMGCYGATVITALTSQNTLGVQGVMPVPQEVVGTQLKSVLDDLHVRAIKIGQIPNQAVAACIVETLCQHHAAQGIPVIYDPVMISTSGRQLMEPDCIDYLKANLFPRCTLVTPNLPEAEKLVGQELTTSNDIDMAGRQLSQCYHTAFLLKGGHAEGEEMTDRLYMPDGNIHQYSNTKIHSTNLHGTGCTLSSAIASAMAQGHNLVVAVEMAKSFVTAAIQKGIHLNIGKGNGPLWP